MKSQRCPRLYISIIKDGPNYKVEYYNNQYNADGSFIINSMLLEPNEKISFKSSQKQLNHLNKIEFQLLNNLIEKQKKVIQIYLEKNKRDQHKIIESSLQLLLEYKNEFLKWFINNKIVEKDAF